MKQTLISILTLGVKLAADTEAHIAVTATGAVANVASDTMLGTTERAGKSGERVGVVVLGKGIAIANEAIAIGDGLKVVAKGKLAKVTAGKTIVGRALTAATKDGDLIEYVCIPN